MYETKGPDRAEKNVSANFSRIRSPYIVVRIPKSRGTAAAVTEQELADGGDGDDRL